LIRTGQADLPLHRGRAPQWLVKRMINLARQIITVILDEYGHDVFLQRISDPYWFQALGCVLGYDWHSSGVTTVLTGVLKSAINPADFGLAVCGGKGRASTKAQFEIGVIGTEFGFSPEEVNQLKYASKMSAKVDNAAIQAGYPLYHHAFFITNEGKWAVIQQGMNTTDRTARRYHWLSNKLESFVKEPHAAIVGNIKRNAVLDMTSTLSEACRKTSVDLAKEKPRKIVNMFNSIKVSQQKTIQDWLPTAPQRRLNKQEYEYLFMPARINWEALKKAYEFQPRNYEELLSLKGIGPATVRGLALISELIYGAKPSWKDPVKYSFAYGGKDGVPFPVDRKSMDASIQILREAIENARLGNKERIRSLRRLRRFVPSPHI